MGTSPTTSPTAEPTDEPTTHRPTTVAPTTASPTTAKPTKRPTTAEPTKRHTGWGAFKPTKPTAAKPTRPIKTPRPTKAPRTKAPRPVRTPRPKPVKTPSPTHGGDYGPGDEGNGGYDKKKDKNTMAPLDNQEMIAVDMNGVSETTFTGYSAQTEIVGLSSVVTILVLFGCTMVCKWGKDDKYT